MKPIQLKGFERVSLNSGEEKTVTFKISPQQLAQYKKDLWLVEADKYEFKVGASCTDIRLKGILELSGNNLILENGRNVFFAINE